MARKRYKPEEIIPILREIEVLTSQRRSVPEQPINGELWSKPTTGGVVNMAVYTIDCGEGQLPRILQ